MACSSFTDCINDPLQGLDAANSFATLGSTAVFSINLALYVCYIILTVGIVWFLMKGIYSIIGADDSSESFERLRGAVTNAVFAAVALVLVFSIRFIFVTVLNLLGIDEADNIFMDGPLNQLFGA